jgi:hypothetical protein
MGLAPTPPNLRVPMLAKPLTATDRPSMAWAGFYQDIADRLAAVHKGVVDGTDAAPGDVGEYLEATAGPVSLANGIAANVVSLDLTAGDWDVWGNMQFSAGAGTHTFFGAGVTAVDTLIVATFPASAIAQGISPAPRRVNVTATTTTWLVAEAGFTGTMTATGTIRARRVR